MLGAAGRGHAADSRVRRHGPASDAVVLDCAWAWTGGFVWKLLRSFKSKNQGRQAACDGLSGASTLVAVGHKLKDREHLLCARRSAW